MQIFWFICRKRLRDFQNNRSGTSKNKNKLKPRRLSLQTAAVWHWLTSGNVRNFCNSKGKISYQFRLHIKKLKYRVKNGLVIAGCWQWYSDYYSYGKDQIKNHPIKEKWIKVTISINRNKSKRSWNCYQAWLLHSINIWQMFNLGTDD